MNKLCLECKNFIRHYHNLDGAPEEVYCGHCRKTKGYKLIAPQQKSCEFYEKMSYNKKTIKVRLAIKDINKIRNDLNLIQNALYKYIEE